MGPKKSSHSPKKKVLTPQKKVLTPQKKVLTPQKKFSLPKKKFSLPKKKFSLPNKKFSLPKKKGKSAAELRVKGHTLETRLLYRSDFSRRRLVAVIKTCFIAIETKRTRTHSFFLHRGPLEKNPKRMAESSRHIGYWARKYRSGNWRDIPHTFSTSKRFRTESRETV